MQAWWIGRGIETVPLSQSLGIGFIRHNAKPLPRRTVLILRFTIGQTHSRKQLRWRGITGVVTMFKLRKYLLIVTISCRFPLPIHPVRHECSPPQAWPEALCSSDISSVVSAHHIRISSFMPFLYPSNKLRMTSLVEYEGLLRGYLMAFGVVVTVRAGAGGERHRH